MSDDEESHTCTAVLFGEGAAVVQPCFEAELPNAHEGGRRLRVCVACASGGNLVAGLAAPQRPPTVPLACLRPPSLPRSQPAVPTCKPSTMRARP